MTDRWRRLSGFAPFSTRKTGGVQKQSGSPRSPVTRSLTMPSRLRQHSSWHTLCYQEKHDTALQI